MMFRLGSWMCHFLESHVYPQPSPPPRVRTRPMQVLCVGLPRTGTESLQHALLRLGYEHTFHGWDLIYEQPNYCQEWVRLRRKKWFGPTNGNATLTAADFDPLIGHSVAVTDAIGAVFAAELTEAYPEAKVVQNYHRNLNVWHQSCKDTLTAPWGAFCMAWLWGGCLLDHHNMIRGMVPKERLLEWTVEDGWEPLCRFLERDVPKETFPRTGMPFEGSIQAEKVSERYFRGAMWNLVVIVVGVLIGVVLAWDKMKKVVVLTASRS
ncbi:hypothetical protein QBC44DRAFT_388099 [Cladorrhinum sp. PSN332]|nr:hypothetical protein QBC44DRAFT_388099 [Cladorrhinum sp. PSN332]